MASFDEAVNLVCKKHNLMELSIYQREALDQFVLKRRDIFVNLPTGSGKSMIYLALPLLFDSMYTDTSGHIVVVVSPLVSLMKDQVSSLQRLGITAVSLSDIKDEEIKDIEKGNFSVVYGTPEAWLKCERWRKLLTSTIYNSKLCGIAVDEAHVIKQWLVICIKLLKSLSLICLLLLLLSKVEYRLNEPQSRQSIKVNYYFTQLNIFSLICYL